MTTSSLLASPNWSKRWRQWRRNVQPSARKWILPRLLTTIQELEQIYEQVYVLSAYGSLWFSADTQSSAATTYMNRMQQTLTGMQNRLLFFDLWWKELDDAAAADYCPMRPAIPIITSFWRICAAPSHSRWTRNPNRS